MADQFVRRTGGADWVSYWAAARARELRFQRCTGCRRWRHPPGPMCPHCLSMESECARADRKSTRLNSSHGSISYAVFCLKKKKKKDYTIKNKIAVNECINIHLDKSG